MGTIYTGDFVIALAVMLALPLLTIIIVKLRARNNHHRRWAFNSKTEHMDTEYNRCMSLEVHIRETGYYADLDSIRKSYRHEPMSKDSGQENRIFNI